MKMLLSFCLLLALCGAMSCIKDGDKSCETVVNANGPAFLKVINDRNDEIFVDLTGIIPFGAQVRSGACEIYGLPAGNHTITIENESGTASKDVGISLGSGATYTLSVGNNFF